MGDFNGQLGDQNEEVKKVWKMVGNNNEDSIIKQQNRTKTTETMSKNEKNNRLFSDTQI